MNMEKCEKCIHFLTCAYADNPNYDCLFYYPKEKFWLGDSVYYITGIYNNIIKSATVLEITLDHLGINKMTVIDENYRVFTDFPCIFYKTKEEAEKHTSKQSKVNEEQFFEKYCSLCGTQRCEGPRSVMFSGCLYRSELEENGQKGSN